MLCHTMLKSLVIVGEMDQLKPIFDVCFFSKCSLNGRLPYKYNIHLDSMGGGETTNQTAINNFANIVICMDGFMAGGIY